MLTHNFVDCWQTFEVWLLQCAILAAFPHFFPLNYMATLCWGVHVHLIFSTYNIRCLYSATSLDLFATWPASDFNVYTQKTGKWILCLKIKSLFQIHISIVDSIAVKLMWNYTSVYIRFCVQFSLFAIRFLVEFLNNVLHFIIIHIQAHNL